MKTKFTLLMIVLVLFLGFMFSARSVKAFSDGEHYFSFHHGRSYLDKLEGPNNNKVKLDRDDVNRVAWGGQVETLRVEYSLFRATSEIEKFETSAFSYGKTPGEFTSTGIHLNFYGYDNLLTSISHFSDFWGMGLGLNRYSMNVSVPSETTINDSDHALNWGVFAGFEWKMAPRHRWTLQYRYIFHPEVDFEDQSGDPDYEYDSFRTPSLFLGYRWFY